MMKVIKRDGKIVDFDKKKIKTHPWVAEDNSDIMIETENDIISQYKKEFMKRKEMIDESKIDYLWIILCYYYIYKVGIKFIYKHIYNLQMLWC